MDKDYFQHPRRFPDNVEGPCLYDGTAEGRCGRSELTARLVRRLLVVRRTRSGSADLVRPFR